MSKPANMSFMHVAAGAGHSEFPLMAVTDGGILSAFIVLVPSL
jgi:hypothetical protein